MPIFYTKIYPNEYVSFCAMKDRCCRQKHPLYHRYGGRGIRICDRWLGKEGFKNFIIDMGRKPSYAKTPSGKRAIWTLDRIDHDRDYCPENCRWANWAEQALNRKGSSLLECDGQTKSIREWAAEKGIKRSTLYMRLGHYEMSPREALSAPDLRRKR